MDAFFASVEQRDNSNLKGHPVAVGGLPEQRGVVAAASYEARQFGVHSAMPMAKAVRLCPKLFIVRPNFSKYRSVSRDVFTIFHSVTDLVEPLSVDEAFLDVTKNNWNEPIATNIAKSLKEQIYNTTGLTASAGVAPNKFIAKIASGWKKPNGLTIVPRERVESLLQRLPVDALWGVGPVTARQLRQHKIVALVDVRNFDVGKLAKIVGHRAQWIRDLSFGIDDRPVVTNRPTKSCSSERTYVQDLNDLSMVKSELHRMAKLMADNLLQKGMFTRTVTIKVRYADFSTITRSDTQKHATQDMEALASRAIRLLDRTEAGSRSIRLLGVGAHNLTSSARMTATAKDNPFLWDNKPIYTSDSSTNTTEIRQSIPTKHSEETRT